MASRLATLGRQMNVDDLSDGDDPEVPNSYTLPPDQQTEQAFQPKVDADLATNEARARALGTTGGAAIDAYEASLPDDGGRAEAVTQPEDVERFSAAFFTWNGGSNFTDNPEVRVQREVAPGEWQEHADQSGELPVTLKFPTTQGDEAPYLLGDQQWHWTAHFEAFVAGSEDQTFDTGEREPATPAGTYRFVVDGQRREGGQVVDYGLTSEPFEVKPWDGIVVEDFKFEPDGRASFAVGPSSVYDNVVPGCDPAVSDRIGPIDYPDSYAGTDPRVARFIRNQRRAFPDPADRCNPDQIEWFCFTCSFRPWLDFGDAETARVTVIRPNGTTEVVPATKQDGRWVTSRRLKQNEAARVDAGGVLDRYGDFNGLASPTLVFRKRR
jgi:hypothetical protein